MRLSGAEYPVIEASSVGVIAWVLPKVNIIDDLGLNDYVVARNPDLNLPIQMAHERRAPQGYIDCFSPNVSIDRGHVTVDKRKDELTADRILKCETDFAAMVKSNVIPKRSATVVENPIDDPRTFVRQQYLDVLNREPDPSGLTYWSNQLESCPTGSGCFIGNRTRIPIALSDANEFRETALFAYRMYMVSYGKTPSLADFMRDRSLLSDVHIDWRDPYDTDAAHRSFVDNWVQSDSFRELYPDSMSASEFVRRLFDNANLKQFDSMQGILVNRMNAGASRAQILFETVTSEDLASGIDKESAVPIQLLMQLRQDVSDDRRRQVSPDQLDGADLNQVRRAICLILTSEEYQRRFGDAVTHTNAECP